MAGGNGADESAPSTKSSAKGTRIPDDFAVDDVMRAGARQLGFTDQRIDSITEAFRDYWKGVPGAKGVKLDWPATWRNWMRREAEKLAPRVAPARPAAGELRPWEL